MDQQWRITTKSVKELAKEKGYDSVVGLSNATGVSANAVKRWFFDDASLIMFDSKVLLALCSTLEVEPGDILKLETV